MKITNESTIHYKNHLKEILWKFSFSNKILSVYHLSDSSKPRPSNKRRYRSWKQLTIPSICLPLRPMIYVPSRFKVGGDRQREGVVIVAVFVHLTVYIGRQSKIFGERSKTWGRCQCWRIWLDGGEINT